MHTLSTHTHTLCFLQIFLIFIASLFICFFGLFRILGSKVKISLLRETCFLTVYMTIKALNQFYISFIDSFYKYKIENYVEMCFIYLIHSCLQWLKSKGFEVGLWQTTVRLPKCINLQPAESVAIFDINKPLNFFELLLCITCCACVCVPLCVCVCVCHCRPKGSEGALLGAPAQLVLCQRADSLPQQA